MTGALGTHLQRDVGPWPVLQVSELQISVPIHEVDTEQLLTLGAAEAREALAHGTAALVHTVASVLALGPLTRVPGGRRAGRGLTELPTENERTQVRRGRVRGPGVIFFPPSPEDELTELLGKLGP